MNMSVKTIQDISGVESIIDFLYEINSSLKIAIGQYEKIKCEIEAFDPATKSFKIKLINTKKKYLLKLNGEYNFSARGHDGEVYQFITTCIEDGAIQAKINYPECIEIIKQRKHKRYDTTNMSNPSVEIWTASGSFSFNLNDISQGGISFMVPNHLAEYINIGDKVKIKKVGSLAFEQPLIIEILHYSQQGAKSGGMYRFGGQFC